MQTHIVPKERTQSAFTYTSNPGVRTSVPNIKPVQNRPHILLGPTHCFGNFRSTGQERLNVRGARTVPEEKTIEPALKSKQCGTVLSTACINADFEISMHEQAPSCSSSRPICLPKDVGVDTLKCSVYCFVRWNASCATLACKTRRF